MMSDDYGIDIDSLEHPRDFILGVLWTVRAINDVTNNIRRQMYEFDGSPRAAGIQMMVEKQTEALKAIEVYAQVALGLKPDDTP
jgi:hypothetical protein